MPIYLPEGYKARRHLRKEWGRAKTGEVSPQGTVEDWEHWDGSRDAVVKPAAFRLRIKPQQTGFNPKLAAAIQELEAAIREHERALRSRDVGWRQRTTKRVERAKRQVIEEQGE